MVDEESPYHRYRRWVTEPIASDPAVSVIIPAFNEEFRILPTIGAVATHMSRRGEPWELIISDDGSTDTTARLVADLQFANLRLLTGAKNLGKGNAVRRGIIAARGKVILFVDADQSTPIEQFEQLLTQIEAGADIVVGSRAVGGSAVHGKTPFRKVLSGGLRIIVSRGFGFAVSDTQCGFKLFRRDPAQDLFNRQRIDGFSFDLEILYLAHRAGYRVAEVPVNWIDAPGSTVATGRVTLQFLRDLVRIRLNHAGGEYGRRRRTSRLKIDLDGATTQIDREEATP